MAWDEFFILMFAGVGAAMVIAVLALLLGL
jgi:hypothetical protein